MKSFKMPEIETLEKAFEYNPETGDIKWKIAPSHRIKIGHIVRAPTYNYYVVSFTVNGVQFKMRAHRLAWMLFYREDPAHHEIDHIDGNGKNNRISNLRLSDSAQNKMNSKIRSDNKSGYKGVSFYKAIGRWRGYITLNKKQITVGYFNTAKEAGVAVMKQREELHREFARHQ